MSQSHTVPRPVKRMIFVLFCVALCLYAGSIMTLVMT